MKPFFITGLPRSRTAWLANLLTTKMSFCYHDALSFMHPLDMPKSFDKHSEYYVGDSDSALILHMTSLTKYFPDAPWLFINRAVEEASSSYWKTFADRYPRGPQSQKECDLRFAMLQERLEQAETLVANKMLIPFHRLSNESVIHAIWDFLIPDIPFDYNRWRMLESFQINVIPSKVRFQKILCSQL